MERLDLTPTQVATIAAADHILNAPQEHIALEMEWLNGQGLLDIIDVTIGNLSEIQAVGVGWRVIELTLMRDRVEKGTQL